MRIFKLVLISFFLITSANSNSIYNLIKIPNLEIYELKTPNKLKYFYATKPFRLGVQKNIACSNSDKKTYDKKYQIISKNLNRYSKEFLKKINLKYIVMCENLSISGINTAGIPDHVMKTLIVDLKFNEKYFERVIHHELFHIINDGFKELFNEDDWKTFNNPNFKYAECSTCSKKLGLETYKKTDGFFTEYSMTIPSEDMAEVYSHLIMGDYKNSDDKILNQKIKFIKDRLNEIDNTFLF
ncbi:putative zinc-binding metallopeptidase [Candidatus Pelagibacter sp.]|nr:putative zinc-binding metallopeptidase [Candidatus Pelagibacter sp.]MDB3970252.1 putative zinc-binding metallopeptidase [Candidatus Pelagibacter sp.]MDB4351449.1 putative zinc-binding metallopeptidase [Candidatus Pelagibacter sp.]MDC0405224.1 putative zinc-binding metallopeptidase [Candidatus Pelagibacter sp.]